MSHNGSQPRPHLVVAQRITGEELPESGRVDKVKWNFIYEGDHGLALRLQEEEFSHHFSKNREERWVMRENLKEAKVVQTEEEERLQIARMQEIERMQELTRKDEELARKLQEQEEHKTTVRGPDEERQLRSDEVLAVRLEEYEKARMKRYREYHRRQIEVEDVRRAMVTVNLSEAPQPPVPPETPLPEEEHFDSDFTDFLSQLPEGLTADEIKVIQELEDSELAKLLQEAESKRSGAKTAVERMAYIRRRAVELRDEQLARLVQQREINRYNERRAKSMTNSSVIENGNGSVASNNYIPQPVPMSAPATTSRVYSTASGGPRMNDVYANFNQQQMPPQRPAPTRPRPISSVEPSSTYQRPLSNSSRNETVNEPPWMKQTPTLVAQDDYLTPNTLIDGTGTGTTTIPELTEYEMPPEMSQTVEIDHVAIAAARNRRHIQQKLNAPSTMPAVFVPPALPVVSPGAPPTAVPPAHRLQQNAGGSSPLRQSLSSPLNNNKNDMAAIPVVTNPMYIIERPSKSKNKNNSDCKTQ